MPAARAFALWLAALALPLLARAFDDTGVAAALDQFAPPEKGPETASEREKLSGGLQEIFTFLDADGDGWLQEHELVTRISEDSEWRYQLLYILEGMRLTPQECKQLFGLLDSDGSGAIDRQEFLQGADFLRGQECKRAKEAIRLVIGGEPAMDLARSSFTETCSIDGNERCPLSRMHKDKPALIFPGGMSRCLSDTDQLFAFRVYPGDSDKLYLDFQGGGACFNEYTTMKQTMCKTGISETPTTGIYNKSDIRNPFKDHTIVQVVYCSGDLHIGGTARQYGGVVQRGYANAQTAVDWAQENLTPRLSSLVIGGCSAGSLATQMWSSRVLQTFKYEHAAVLADSYLDLFPGQTQERLLKDLGLCDTPLVSGPRKVQCSQGNLTVHTLFEDAMVAFPTVTFAQVNSKYDKTQLYFHQAVAYTSGIMPELTDGPSYLGAVNARLRRFHRHPNYVSFLINNEQHCFTPEGNFYTVTSDGDAHGRRATKLVDWVASLLRPNETKHSECIGERLSKDSWKCGGVSYCDAGTPEVAQVSDLVAAATQLWSKSGGEVGRSPHIDGVALGGPSGAGAAAGRALSAAAGAAAAGSVAAAVLLIGGAAQLERRWGCRGAAWARREAVASAKVPAPAPWYSDIEEQELLLMPL
mmetsp:Transcript_74173/g.241190  ORF Transcript_74173/g.241190 Transcript_74173/m.241190 type:complete len:642 (+) Transcript_74173:77-2002(+)